MMIDRNVIRGFARSMEKQALDLDPAIIGALLGAGGGGLAGYHLTEDPRHRVRNMLLGGGAGALGGGLIGGRIGGESETPPSGPATKPGIEGRIRDVAKPTVGVQPTPASLKALQAIVEAEKTHRMVERAVARTRSIGQGWRDSVAAR